MTEHRAADPGADRPLFHEPWWLDAGAPGSWSEVTVDEGGRTVGRLPFIERRWMGLRFVLAPPLAARLGPFVELDAGRGETRLRRYDRVVTGLIDQLPACDLFRQNISADLPSWEPFYRAGFQIEPMYSYVLDDIGDDARIRHGFARRTAKAIEGAERRLHVEVDENADRLVRMVELTFSRRSLEIPYDKAILDRLVTQCLRRERGVVLSAVDDGGNVHAAAFGAWDRRRAWYIAGGGDPDRRSSGGGSLLIAELIRRASSHVDTFDFEGSMLPGVDSYFRSFGGRQETFYKLTRTSARFKPVFTLWQHEERANLVRDPDAPESAVRRTVRGLNGVVRRASDRDS